MHKYGSTYNLCHTLTDDILDQKSQAIGTTATWKKQMAY